MAPRACRPLPSLAAFIALAALFLTHEEGTPVRKRTGALWKREKRRRGFCLKGGGDAGTAASGEQPGKHISVRLPTPRTCPVFVPDDRVYNRFWDFAERWRQDNARISHQLRQDISRGDVVRGEEWMYLLNDLTTYPSAKAFLSCIEANAGDVDKAEYWLNKMKNISKSVPDLVPPIRAYSMVMASYACNDRPEAAKKLLLEIVEDPELRPDAFTIHCAIEAHRRADKMRFVDQWRKYLKTTKLIKKIDVAERYLMWSMIHTGNATLVREELDRLGIVGTDEKACMLQVYSKTGDVAQCERWMEKLLMEVKIEDPMRERNATLELLAGAFNDMMMANWNAFDVQGMLRWYNRSQTEGIPQIYHLKLNALRAYAEISGEQTEKLFFEILKEYKEVGHDIWSLLLEGLSRDKQLQRAKRYAYQMRKLGHKPDAYTYEVCITNAVAEKAWGDAEEFLTMCVKDRVRATPECYIEVVRHAAFSDDSADNRVKKAQYFLHMLLNNGVYVDTRAINHALDAMGQLHMGPTARHLLEYLRRFDVQPDVTTYALTMKACAMTPSWGGEETLNEMLEDPYVRPTITAYNNGIDACGRFQYQIECNRDASREAFFKLMNDTRVRPNLRTFMVITWPLVRLGWTHRMEEYRDLLFNEETGLKPDVNCYNRMLKIWHNDVRRPRHKPMVKIFRELCERGLRPSPETVKIIEGELGWQARDKLLEEYGWKGKVSSVRPASDGNKPRAGGVEFQVARAGKIGKEESYYCPGCGEYNEHFYQFCKHCGQPKPGINIQKYPKREPGPRAARGLTEGG